MRSIDHVKRHKRAMIIRFAKSDDAQGVKQLLMTLAPLALLWLVAVEAARTSDWLAAAIVPLISLFTLRVFALMHECGHGSLCRSRGLNRAFGFTLGVLSGMPQFVWSQHHNYHHAHNGNWDRYRGPYATLTVEEYAAMSAARRRLYRGKCSIAAAPLAGFIYLIFNPRFTWARGSLGLVIHIVRGKLAKPGVSVHAHAAGYKTRYWKSRREYWHMFWNNVALLSAWAVIGWVAGYALFFAIYLVSLSFAGAAGIVLFTVQHNFEHAYASREERWDHDTGAIEGTSFLILPCWLNWFTLNIAYHHIHHLSASIPGYCLAKCHAEYEHLFASVTRVRLAQIPSALHCILWDTSAQRIISMEEFGQHA